MATTTLTVFAYGNVDALHGIFNAIAMITSAPDFNGLMKVGILIGFMVVGTMAMFPWHLRRGAGWFMIVAAFTSITVGPKADIQIVDQLGQQPAVVVANVPYMLALIAQVKTAIGSTLTQAFETAFQTIPDPTGKTVLDSELSYIEHGYMFGARAVRMSREADFSKLYTQGDTYNFLRNCIFPSQGRDSLADQIENSPDLMSVYANPNPALASAYHDPAQNFGLVFDTCDKVYNALQPLLNQEGLLAVSRAAKRAFPDLPQGVAEQKLEASLMAIYNKGTIGAAYTSASQIMLQNLMINATADASALYAASLNDPSLIMYSSMRSQAVQQMNAGNLVAGRLAEEALPMIRNVIDAILYAVWPIICIVAMLSEGPALAAMIKNYLMTLAWVEMWPPIFAVTNYLQTLASAKHLAAAGLTQTGTGMTLATATGLYSSAVSDVAIAAYMVTAVPIIAAGVLWGMNKVLSIAGAAAGAHAAQQEAAAGSKGNLSTGNVTMEQQTLAENLVQPGFATRTGIGGTESVNLLTGERVSHQASSRYIVSTQDVQSITSQQSEATARATTLAETAERSYASSADTAMSEALSFARSAGTGATRSLSFDVGKVGSDGLSAEEKLAASKQISERYGIGDASAVGKALDLALHGGGSGSPTSKLGSLSTSITSMLGAKASSSDAENLAKDLVTASDAMRSIGDQRRHELMNQVRTGDSFQQARQSNREGAERVESAFRKSETWRETAATSLTQAKSAQEEARKISAAARTTGIDWNNLIDREMSRRGVSVADTVGDPVKMQRLIRDIILGGEVFKYDVEEIWTHEPATRPQDPIPGVGVSGMRDVFLDANPGRGKKGVGDQHLVNDAALRAKQAAGGVQPGAQVSGADVQHKVDAGLAGAAKDIKTVQHTDRLDAGEKQDAFDERAGKVSDYHRPIWGQNPITEDRIANKALDGVQGTDGTIPKPFKDEKSEFYKEEAKKRIDPSEPRPEIPK